jgi:hypothetical protein
MGQTETGTAAGVGTAASGASQGYGYNLYAMPLFNCGPACPYCNPRLISFRTLEQACLDNILMVLYKHRWALVGTALVAILSLLMFLTAYTVLMGFWK